jgi:hypothetical protein
MREKHCSDYKDKPKKMAYKLVERATCTFGFVTNRPSTPEYIGRKISEILVGGKTSIAMIQC